MANKQILQLTDFDGTVDYTHRLELQRIAGGVGSSGQAGLYNAVLSVTGNPVSLAAFAGEDWDTKLANALATIDSGTRLVFPTGIEYFSFSGEHVIDVADGRWLEIVGHGARMRYSGVGTWLKIYSSNGPSVSNPRILVTGIYAENVADRQGTWLQIQDTGNTCVDRCWVQYFEKGIFLHNTYREDDPTDFFWTEYTVIQNCGIRGNRYGIYADTVSGNGITYGRSQRATKIIATTLATHYGRGVIFSDETVGRNVTDNTYNYGIYLKNISWYQGVFLGVALGLKRSYSIGMVLDGAQLVRCFGYIEGESNRTVNTHVIGMLLKNSDEGYKGTLKSADLYFSVVSIPDGSVEDDDYQESETDESPTSMLISDTRTECKADQTLGNFRIPGAFLYPKVHSKPSPSIIYRVVADPATLRTDGVENICYGNGVIVPSGERVLEEYFYQHNLISNARFVSSLNDWNGVSWTWNDGTALHTVGLTEWLTQAIYVYNPEQETGLCGMNNYLCGVQIKGRTAGSVVVWIGQYDWTNGIWLHYTAWQFDENDTEPELTANGTGNFTITGPTGYQTIGIEPTADFDGSIDSIALTRHGPWGYYDHQWVSHMPDLQLLSGWSGEETALPVKLLPWNDDTWLPDADDVKDDGDGVKYLDLTGRNVSYLRLGNDLGEIHQIRGGRKGQLLTLLNLNTDGGNTIVHDTGSAAYDGCFKNADESDWTPTTPHTTKVYQYVYHAPIGANGLYWQDIGPEVSAGTNIDPGFGSKATSDTSGSYDVADVQLLRINNGSTPVTITTLTGGRAGQMVTVSSGGTALLSFRHQPFDVNGLRLIGAGNSTNQSRYDWRLFQYSAVSENWHEMAQGFNTFDQQYVYADNNVFPIPAVNFEDKEPPFPSLVLNGDLHITGRLAVGGPVQAATAISDESVRPLEAIVVAVSDETTSLTTGAGKVTFRMPWSFYVQTAKASVTTAPTGAALTVDVNEDGVSIMSTGISIDASEKTSTTAATPPVISDPTLADDAEITVDIDQVGSTVAGAGLKVTLIGYRL